MRVLDRAVLAELAAPFAFGVGAFTAILAAGNVGFYLVTLMTQHGLPAAVVGEVMLLRLPETAFFTFPMAVLLAALLGVGRLAADGELGPWLVAGVSPARLLVPVVFFGGVVGLATWGLDELVAPPASATARQVLHAAIHHQPLPTTHDHLFFNEIAGDRLVRTFYARRFDGREMRDVVVQEFEGGQLARVVQAVGASRSEGGWQFRDGITHQVGVGGELRYSARFATQVIALGPDLARVATEGRQPSEMDAATLGAHIDRLARAGAPARDLDGLRVAWHQKAAVPATAVPFALLGAVLGWRPRTGGAARGLGVSVLFIFGYYMVMFGGMALGQTGVLAPWLGAWLPVGGAAIAGLIGVNGLGRPRL